MVLLSLNPGYAPKEDEKHQLTSKFMGICRKSLAHKKIPYPFYFLDPKLEGEKSGPGHRWWKRKLNSLIQHLNLNEDEALLWLSRNLFCIEYFPYRSRNYHHMKEPLDSQKYNFELARSAMRRRAHIILTRSKRHWFEAVPELESYTNLHILKNPRNPTISQGNLPEAFLKIVSVLKIESPSQHKKILAKRLAKIEAGKGKFLALAQFKKRLAKRRLNFQPQSGV